jgi:TolB-like protein
VNFADGISEDAITGLSAYRSMRVIARTSSFRYRDSDLSIPAIAESSESSTSWKEAFASRATGFE